MDKLDRHVKPQMKCPHCDAELSLREAITILNGTGFRQLARVRYKGKTFVQDAGSVNPLAVEVLE